jgi:hypothetical protein
MPTYTDLRDAWQRARDHRASMASALAAARAAVKHQAKRRVAVTRVARPGGDHEHDLERAALRLDEVVTAAREALVAAQALEAEALAALGEHTDPTLHLGRLDDRIPILLLPVRLETRFKTITLRNRPEHQLWVRVYPDDCWIDSFHPALTETEVANARAYWIGMWKAGGIAAQERAAWRALVGKHGSGRAGWIVSQYLPVNLAEQPSKTPPEDVILVIAAAAPPPATELTDIATFWEASWRADGAAVETAAAHAALVTAVGAARAEAIARDLVPDNFAAPLADGFTKPQVGVQVKVLVLPAPATEPGAWSQAPRVTALPERFVFIGYRGTETPLVVVGNHVPPTLAVGPDPSAPEAEQLHHDADGNLVLPEELRWLADFDRAVDAGMGFRITLTPAQAQDGFDRVLVVGVRVTDGEATSQAVLETLLAHHAASRKGLALVPQGTPTNNTEAAGSGLARLDDPDESFDDRRTPRFAIESDWRDKRDGQWLAEYLGVDPALFQHVHDAGATDLRAARAMHTALWPATLGYWMESMMTPAFTRRGIAETRGFFERHVVGGGAIPALRIGTQPYGVLPATAFSKMAWFATDDDRDDGPRIAGPRLGSAGYLARLHALLMGMHGDWAALAKGVSFVGREGDPHKLLLDVVGLHPGSVEWSQRYAESFQTVFNRLNLRGLGGLFQAIVLSLRRAAAIGKLEALGGSREELPPILSKLFSGRHQELRGGVVDDKPLSEDAALRAQTPGGANYLRWLVDAAGDSLDALYAQDGFTDDAPPRALLYLLLRHALQLGYHDTGVALHELAGLYDGPRARKARQDDPFLHVRGGVAESESRYQPLYALAEPITGSATLPVHRYIATKLPTLLQAAGLRDQLAAIERLHGEPTARLERAFADHVDTCTYRLDAWLLGLVDHQLELMRAGSPAAARRGVHLGAYAWLEHVRPENKVLVPHAIRDPQVAADFAAGAPLVRDSTNQGYIHTPSSNHAVAAAVLRNGFISNASDANRQTLAVNLSSERVRTALALLEGVRAGQGLADLLGYRFERGLHDGHALAEVDQFIYKLRRAFPLRANHFESTKPPEGVAIQTIEARNVLDGLALVEHIKKSGIRTYPFGKPGLPDAGAPAAQAALDAEAVRLLDAHDAVADLALSEGVYQAVLGNYDRVASTYDAYARGNFPPEPDIVRTPTIGTALTHRVALHLDPTASPTASPVVDGAPVPAPIPMTPRAQAEPAVNRWLASVLPPPAQVGCTVTFLETATGTTRTRLVTLDALALQPADLIALLGEGNPQAMTELDDRVARHAVTTFGPRPDAPITVAYLEKGTAPVSVFELLPLAGTVRRLLAKARPLRATDLALASEARTSQDDDRRADQTRLDLVRAALVALRGQVDALAAAQEARLADLATRRGELLLNVDADLAALVTVLASAARFAMPQAGWGFAYEARRRIFAAVLAQAAAVVVRWNTRLVDFTTWLGREAALPGTASDVQRFIMLEKAERALSTVPTTTLPATPAMYRDALVNVLQPAFVAKRDALAALATTTRTSLALLLADVQALLPVTAFDEEPYTLVAHEDQIVKLAEDAASVLRVVVRECDRRLAAVTAAYAAHAAAAAPGPRLRALEVAAKAMLGEDFVIVPAFTLAAAQGDELDNALTASRSGELFTHLTTAPAPGVEPLEDFPVDTWLYGIARVRDKMRAWEQTMVLAGSLGRPEPALDALQLPFTPGDRWLGLEFPAATKLDHDRLLYTACFAQPFAKAAPQCGFLLDEWTETIPGADVHTGIAFHHDRPNCEAPQTMLLVTPSRFRGAWSWSDLLDALDETLQLAKLRAVEPHHLDGTAYAWFLPATIMAAQVRQLTIAANLALNNRLTIVK